MTWTVPPVGFVPDYFAAASDVTASVVPPSSTTTISCPRTPEQIAIDGIPNDTGLVPETFTGHASFPIAAAAAAVSTGMGGLPDFTDGEFRFAIDVSAVSDIGISDGGYTACRTPPDNLFGSQLTGYANGHSHAELDGSTLLVQYDTGVPISSSSIDDDTGFGLGGRLVNPSPSWATPDAYGNTAGSTLWTLDELATASAGIDWDVYWTTSGSAHIAMRAIIVAYWMSGPVPRGFMCIV